MTIRLQRLSLYSLIGICFVWLLHITWFRWGNLIVDTFRDQWIFYQLSRGKVLYKDILYVYGFLPSYLMGFLYRLLGVRMQWTAYVGMVVTLVTTASIYRIGRLFLNRVLATLLTLHFLFFFAFGDYGAAGICNFIIPYSIASTFCFMFLLWGLYCFLKYLQRERISYLRWWVALLVCACFCRIDYSLLVWLVSVLIGIAHALLKKQYRRLWYFFAMPAISVIGYALFVIANNAFEGFKESALRVILFAGSNKSYFSLLITGFFDMRKNVGISLMSFAIHIIALGFFYVLSAKFYLLGKRFQTKTISVVIVLFLALCSFATSYTIMKKLGLTQYRLLPFLLLFGIIFYCFQLFPFRKQSKPKAWIGLTIFSSAFVLIIRILLKAGPTSYGFLLCIPGLICYFIFCFLLYPSLFAVRFAYEDQTKKYYQMCVAIFLLVLAVPFFQFGPMAYRSRTLKLDFGSKATMYCNASSLTHNFLKAFLYLHDHAQPDDSIVVLPEGIGLNFLLPRDSAVRYTSLVPNCVFLYDEKKIVQALQQRDIDYVVVVNRMTYEYGFPFFGIDYGKRIAQWIVDNYVLEKLIGPYPFTSSEFGIAIYKKIDNK